MRAIYPYSTVGRSLELRPVRLTLDRARELDVSGSSETRSIDLHSHALHWDELELELEVFVPREVPDSASDFGVTAVFGCRPANLRVAQPLRRSPIDPSRWSGSLRLSRDATRSRATLRALLSGTVDEVPHRLIGESDEWTLQVDEPEIPPVTGAIRVKWLRFDDPDVEPRVLNRFYTESFFISVDEASPTLYLNKGFPNLPGLLVDRRRTGAAAAIHDATRSAIAAKAWLAMFNAAAAEVFQSDADEPASVPEGWRGDVLRRVLEFVYELSDTGEAVERLRDAWRVDAGGTVQPLAVAAVEQLVGAGKLLRRGMQALSASELQVPVDVGAEAGG